MLSYNSLLIRNDIDVKLDNNWNDKPKRMQWQQLNAMEVQFTQFTRPPRAEMDAIPWDAQSRASMYKSMVMSVDGNHDDNRDRNSEESMMTNAGCVHATQWGAALMNGLLR